MKRRMFLFNIFSVLAALVALFLISNGVMQWISSSYQSSTKPPPNNDNMSQIQDLINTWDTTAQDWAALDAALSDLNYSLYVAQAGETVYSSYDEYQTEFYNRVVTSDSVWSSTGSFALQNDGVLIVGKSIDSYTVAAMHHLNSPTVFGRPRMQSEMLSIALFVSGVIAIIIIVLLSIVFTRYQVKHALKPVNALTDASRRVEQGNLTQPIAYAGKDEFQSVCTAFDHMQQHLLEERCKNTSYEQARTDMVAGISHDLRTPLTSVKGYIKGLRDGVANTPEKKQLYLDIAYQKACDMDVLLQRLFYFSKMETGSLPLFPEDVDLYAFVRNFADNSREELAHMGVALTVAPNSATHPVHVDTEQMYRVLNNLLDNAIHYAGAPQLAITISVWRERDTERLRFSDNGTGVSEEHLPHLFEQFWRGDEARGGRSGGEGSGLGLYIVKYIVEAHGGTVTARNDHGLVFEISLPCREEG
ncbi:MAG: HAMP domain-containing histidine kinase [Oscillospiraceae bacterium]|nr:HAMP domain-containing histidine kinase [Oscillospiraceae bacterium]